MKFSYESVWLLSHTDFSHLGDMIITTNISG